MDDDKWEVVAGEDVGYSRNHFVCVNLGTGEKKPCKAFGHYVYVKKCKKAEDQGGILIPEKSQSDTTVVLILAFGDKCGTFRRLSKAQKKRKGMRSSVCWDGIGVNSKVFAPDQWDWGMMREPTLGPDIFRIDECLIIGAVEE
jgi:hypothetical protein